MARLQKKKTPTDKAKAKVHESEGLQNDSKDKETSENRVRSTPQVLKSKNSDSISAVSGKQNFYQKAVQFFREVRVELKKVTWPNQKQTAGSTVVVIILVFILAAFLGLVDFGLSKLVQVVLA